jgi:hypothetical protein
VPAKQQKLVTKTARTIAFGRVFMFSMWAKNITATFRLYGAEIRPGEDS